MRGAIGTVSLVSRIKPMEMWHACSKTLQNNSSAIEKETLMLNPQGQGRSGRQKRSWRRMIEEEDKIVGNIGKEVKEMDGSSRLAFALGDAMLCAGETGKRLEWTFQNIQPSEQV